MKFTCQIFNMGMTKGGYKAKVLGRYSNNPLINLQISEHDFNCYLILLVIKKWGSIPDTVYANKAWK